MFCFETYCMRLPEFREVSAKWYKSIKKLVNHVLQVSNEQCTCLYPRKNRFETNLTQLSPLS